MSHKEKCQALFGSALVILKNVTVIIPIIEGMIYTIWDLIKPAKKEKNNGRLFEGSLQSEDCEKVTETSAEESRD